jgi:primosomal protein N' (replication factor Y)
MNRARLVIFNAALGPLDYRVPEGMDGRAGLGRGRPARTPPDRRNRLGSRTASGDRGSGGQAAPAVALLPVPPLRAELRRLIEWTADYYCASLASVARMVLASGGALRGTGDDDRVPA